MNKMDRIAQLRDKMQAANMPAELVSEITEHILNVEQDLNYHQAILNGTWTSARRIMLESLLKMEPTDG